MRRAVTPSTADREARLGGERGLGRERVVPVLPERERGGEAELETLPERDREDEVRTDEVLDHGGRAEHRAALGAQRLGERGGDDHVVEPGEAELADQSVAARPGHAEAVRLVDDEHRAVRRAHTGQLEQGSGVAEHRVDRLDDHHRPALAGGGQRCRDRGDVVVRGDRHLRLREPDRVDEATRTRWERIKPVEYWSFLGLLRKKWPGARPGLCLSR